MKVLYLLVLYFSVLSNEIDAIYANDSLSCSNAEILQTIGIELYNLVRSEMTKCGTLNRMNFLIECRILSCNVLNAGTKFSRLKNIKSDVIKAYCRSGISILKVNEVNIRGIYCYERVFDIIEEVGGIDGIIKSEKSEEIEICLESIYEMLISYIQYISREENKDISKLIKNIKILSEIITFLSNKIEEIYSLMYILLYL